MNVREYQRGHQIWTIQRNWQHRVQKDEDKKKKKHNTICVGHHFTQTNIQRRYSNIDQMETYMRNAHSQKFAKSNHLTGVQTILGVKPIIHQSELRTYAKVVPLKKIVPFALLYCDKY